jgi:hypothetical protein
MPGQKRVSNANGTADPAVKHEAANHSAEEWVRGDVHTNGNEGVWSLFKRSIVGSYSSGEQEASGFLPR